VRIAAPAKVNFGLRIVGRRADGLHELESVFLPLDFADEVELETQGPAAPHVELALVGASEGAPADASNLAARAAEVFLAETGLRCAVRIRLTKRIPAQAGLGGGSSDAGAVLRGLAERFPEALGADALEALALGLGADVPFFLDPCPALVSGVGERREPLEGWPAWTLLLANPGTPLPTGRVFAAFDAQAVRPATARTGASLRSLTARACTGSRDPARALEPLLHNDLEPAAAGLCPEIEPLRDRLRESGALAVGLSGSGATLYGVFADEGEAARAQQEIAGPGWARVARTAESR
jgi:4-diphosphocytidyl-2-C-methyl-D-erythritol kinase